MLIPLLLKLLGTSVFEQNVIDQMMIDLDGTPNKSKLGQMPFLVFLLLQKQPLMN
jgi:enolase